MPTDQKILVICTGNICRSAYAQYRLQRALEPLGDNAPPVISRGTYVNPGLRPPQILSDIVSLSVARDLSAHLPVQLSDHDVHQASIILAASEEHLTDALRRAPAKMKSAFTIAEFAAATRLLIEDKLPPGADRLTALKQVASTHRSGIRAELLQDIDIEDPYGHDARSYKSMVATVDRYVDKIAGFLLADGISTASRLD